ncbi:MAG: hypothetical protein RMJ56_06450 [Gemmataceae bacterium]|nr:hypothetical protein [Gemmata sp.]MDW8197230.1 hypothetical protein [Gemmataceae bacterium]
MRYTLVCAVAVFVTPWVVAQQPSAAPSARPLITFQTPPVEKLLNDLRTVADHIGGEKAVQRFNTALKEKFGDKGLEGLDLSKPIFGYIHFGETFSASTVVVAIPSSTDKEFLALCSRLFDGEQPKDLGKGLYELPGPSPEAKVRLTFADQYAYVAIGLNPDAVLDAKVRQAPAQVIDPAETAFFSGKLHFDRLTPELKKALPTYFAELKKQLENDDFIPFPPLAAVIRAPIADIEKLFTRYLLLLTGADSAAVRVNIDQPTGELFVDLLLNPKKGTALAQEIAARKPTGNKFAGVITPDTVVGFKTRLPFFNDELKAASGKVLEELQKLVAQAGPDAPKDFLDELVKGLRRTIQAGEVDLAGAIRGPDKNGDFTLAVAAAFDDPSGVEKEFKKMFEAQATPDDKERMKWNADKAGTIAIHTYQIPHNEFSNFGKPFGDAKATAAFCFAPKGVYVVVGPDPVPVLKDLLKLQPQESPVVDVLINPARLGKLVEKTGGDRVEVEKVLGKDDQMLSAVKLAITGGEQLKVRLSVNLRLLPRALFMAELIPGEPGVVPPPPVEKR